jgi:hypothetical protein
VREGKVVRVLSSRAIVIDLGQNEGVKEGMRFGIHTQVDAIVDPATGRRLGDLDMRKATVVAEAVYPQFSVASPPTRTESPSIASPLATRRVPGNLEVGKTEPLPGAGPVSVGDRVIAIPDA